MDSFMKPSVLYANCVEFHYEFVDQSHSMNAVEGIDYSPQYLERFFRNLLLGEQWDLRNRYLHIHPTTEWSVQPNLADSASTPPLDQKSLATKGTQEIPEQVLEQVPEQVADLLHTNNTLVIDLIKKIGNESVSISQLMKLLELKHRPNFLEYHLNPAMKEGYVRMLYPNSPRHPRQKYLLTVKGMALYNELTKKK